MTKIISVINQKGGVGKTTTAINLGCALANTELKILVVDLDPQGNASTGLGIEFKERNKTIYELMISKDTILNPYIYKSSINNLDVIPSNVDLSGFETEVAEDGKRAFFLNDVLRPLAQSNQYDYILVDCPPSLSLLTIMALVGSDTVLVPLQSEFFALEGLSQLVKTINRVKQNLNTSLSIQGIVLTMFDKRNKLCYEVEKEARKYFPNEVYKTVIPRNIRISEAPSHGLPVIIYDKNCSGTRAYEKLAHEILEQEKQNNTFAA